MIADTAKSLRENIQKVIVGKDEVIDLALIALLCEGHLLLEDVPGTGKTKLARTIAASLSCTFQRIQFTPDLLPSDVSQTLWEALHWITALEESAHITWLRRAMKE